jgi:hypothetical protein
MKILLKFISKKYNHSSDLMGYIENSIKQLIRSHLDFIPDKYDVMEKFENLNICKFEKTRLVVEIEDHFQVNFSDQEFLEIQTPFDCVTLVNRYLSLDYSLRLKEDLNLSLR